METALPNLHPAVIHFPLALIPIAVLLDAAALARSDSRGLDLVACGAWVAGAITALAAWLAGRDAAEHIGVVSADVQAALNAHADQAELAGMAIGVVAAGRALASWRLPGQRLPRTVLLAAGLTAAALLLVAADRGGALVYQHAVAVALPDAPVCPDCVTVASGELPQGMILEADGRRVLLLGEPVGDVQVSARLELLDFAGRVGLVHHWGEQAGAFVVDTRDATASLTARSGELDRATAVFGGDVVLVTSAIGTHYKGYVDGQMVTHGHADAEGPGLPGILLDGRGRVRVLAIEVQAQQDGGHVP